MDKKNLLGAQGKDYLPMIRPKTEELLISLLREHKPKTILEIGTFLGYSAGVMSETLPEATIISLEKDEETAKFAQKNLDKFKQIKVVCCDADTFLKQNKQKFDFVFLDGPKGQYNTYLPYIKGCLNLGGVLMADDVLFYGLVKSAEHIEHKHRTIVENLRKFLNSLCADPNFETQLFEFEDGVSVSIKRK